MRLAWVILFLAVLAVGLVHIRRTDVWAQHEIQRLDSQDVSLRRAIWLEQGEFYRRSSPMETDRRADQLGLRLLGRHQGSPDLAGLNDYSNNDDIR